MSQYDPKFNGKLNVGHCDLHFMANNFAIFVEYLLYKHHTFKL